MRNHHWLSTILVLGLVMLVPIGAFGTSRPGSKRARAQTAGAAAIDISSFEGLGTWVDMFNKRPWKNPERGVRKMDERGVETIYVQTANYSSSTAIYKPSKLGRLIDAAHARGMAVVSWYLPSFKNLERDLKRAKKALTFRSATGETFDAFALDIEATTVNNISRRNARALRLSKQIRRAAPRRYPLGAIIPDPAGQVYWPSFPYKEMNEYYDVFLPMGYYTYRVSGYADTYDYAARNITIIRDETGDPGVPVHAIGGIAGRASKREVKAFVAATRDNDAIGGSLYDYAITEAWEWELIRKLRRLGS